MKFFKFIWNFLIFLAVYSEFRNNDYFRKTIIVIFTQFKLLIVCLVNSIQDFF